VTEQSWAATGVIEAPPAQVCEVFLRVAEGRVGPTNAALLSTVPGAGRFLAGATLRGGPDRFTIHYGPNPGGTVERTENTFAFQGGFKFRAEYHFTSHEKGTLLTYRAVNVAPPSHRDKRLVRLQFRLAGRLKVGLRGTLRRIGRRLNCRAYPARELHGGENELHKAFADRRMNQVWFESAGSPDLHDVLAEGADVADDVHVARTMLVMLGRSDSGWMSPLGSIRCRSRGHSTPLRPLASRTSVNSW